MIDPEFEDSPMNFEEFLPPKKSTAVAIVSTETLLNPKELPPVDLELVRAHGRFYKDIIEITASTHGSQISSDQDVSKAVINKIHERIQIETPKAQQAYRIALHYVVKALLRNETDVRRYKQEKMLPESEELKVTLIKALVDRTLLVSGFDTVALNLLLENPNQLKEITLHSSLPGLYELSIPKEYLRFFVSNHHASAAHMILAFSYPRVAINFLLIPNKSDKGSREERDNAEIEHELHHAIWFSLERMGNKLISPPSEDTVALDIDMLKQKLRNESKPNFFQNADKLPSEFVRSLNNFKNELVAYLISFERFGLPLADPNVLKRTVTRSESIHINERAAESIKEISQLISTLKEKASIKDPHLLFIYPAMKAQSFYELSQMCQDIVEKAIEDNSA